MRTNKLKLNPNNAKVLLNDGSTDQEVVFYMGLYPHHVPKIASSQLGDIPTAVGHCVTKHLSSASSAMTTV